jgi:predicted nucleic acid-binding protein
MSVLYVDTSALPRLYLIDEPDADELKALVLAGDIPVATSELSNVELARAVIAAERGRRIASAGPVLNLIGRHLGTVIGVIRFTPETVLSEARRVVLEHRVGTLDAIHLAVALELRASYDENLPFVTRDIDQAAAARALGFPLL